MKANLIRVAHSVGYLKHRVADNTYTACVTDPPYELGFMGKTWDSSGVAFNPATWAEVLRVCKPGAMLFAFGGSRTYHRIACAIEDGGWILRDVMQWMYGSGFPKSLDISKGIDKQAGAEREVVGKSSRHGGGIKGNGSSYEIDPGIPFITAPATPEAELWNGIGTALKPAYEPIIVAMKPLEGTFAENALKWGVAGLNIDGGRIATEETLGRAKGGWGDLAVGASNYSNFNSMGITVEGGRWPSNINLDPYTAGLLDGQAGEQVSRFFYCAKASKEEREAGLENFKTRTVGDGRKKSCDVPCQRGQTERKNTHPTVKPIELMRYLIKLVKMPTDNHVLDLFCGSGTTLCSAALEGIEEATGLDMVQEHIDISKARVQHWQNVAYKGIDYQEQEKDKQGDLFQC
jgi:site-specific DNA-methyltransferase (adenine-specific)